MPKTQKKIHPRGRWVLVRPIEKESGETEQGLSLPATDEKEQKAQGIVVAKGGDSKPDIGIGSMVIYGAFGGEPLKVREEGKEVDYKLLLDEDIIAFVD